VKRRGLAGCALGLALACADAAPRGVVVTFPASAVGAEAQALRDQLRRFERLHPGIRVEPRSTPDAADQRRQLYVQWLAAGASDPDVLQLDVIWTPEFAAAGWLRPLDDLDVAAHDFFPAALDANRWDGRLWALPWFVDVGLLYWRSDLLPAPPQTFADLIGAAERAQSGGGVRHGLVWQGARYEGLVTVFLEHLTAFGGALLDARGDVVVDEPAAVRALTAMRDALAAGVVPRAALTWHEEEARFAFQNGEALFMRNWPYAVPLMQDAERSRVAGRFAVAPFPRADGGRAAAALGGSQLAINARSDAPAAAELVIEFLLAPEQMVERARRVGQYPPRPSLYDSGALAAALPIPASQARAAIEQAVARPASPVYTELSEVLQVWLHRALSGQVEPAAALASAARAMRAALVRAELAPREESPGGG
jgi:multiple sugar transport system substrate-binding protein